MQQFVFQVHELPAVIFFENKVPTIFEGIFYKKNLDCSGQRYKRINC